MTDKYNTGHLFAAYIQEFDIEPNGKCVESGRDTLISKENGVLKDILFPSKSLESTPTHEVKITRINPLYPSTVQKVVSAKQAIKKYNAFMKKIS